MTGRNAHGMLFGGAVWWLTALAAPVAADDMRAALAEAFWTPEVLGAALAVMLVITGLLLIVALRDGRRLREMSVLRAQLHRRERLLETVLDNVSHGIVALDSLGRIEIANEAARDMLGLRRGAAGPEPWPEDARLDAQDRRADPLAEALSGARLRGAACLLERVGKAPLQVRVNAAPAAAPLGVVMTIEDVTEASEARARADRADRLDALGKLTGGVAHDFNNLLSTILGALQLAQRRAGDASPIGRHLDAALRATRTGAALVERLLGFATRGDAAPDDVAVADILAEIMPLAGNIAPPSVRFVTAPVQEGLAARCDRAQIVTAALNLIVNARDAILSGRGRGVVAVTAAPSADRPGFVEIAVTDDGPGMSAEVRARALDPFFTTKGAARGAGLGLSMVYGAVRRCGGALLIDSAPGSGTSVRLLLPRAAAPAPAAEAQAAPCADGAGRGVLIVEDEPELRETIEAMLAELGYRARAVADGPAALQALEADPAIGVVLSDVMLAGGMSGHDIAEALRRSWPDLRVVLMSGYPEGASGAREAAILRKPVTLEGLAAAMRGEAPAPRPADQKRRPAPTVSEITPSSTLRSKPMS
jgi:PAS domain S-box-containing protein